MRSPKQNEEVRVAPFGKLFVAIGVGWATNTEINMGDDQPAKRRRSSISSVRESGPLGSAEEGGRLLGEHIGPRRVTGISMGHVTDRRTEKRVVDLISQRRKSFALQVMVLVELADDIAD